MSSLGNFFPEKLRRSSAQRALKRGTVIRCWVNDTNPPKEKRFIIVGEDASSFTVASIYINSNINPKLFPTVELRDLHIHFNSDSSRPFIEKDSYVDCSQLIPKSKRDLEDLITDNPGYVLGELCEADIKQVISKIKSNNLTLSPIEKAKYALD